MRFGATRMYSMGCRNILIVETSLFLPGSKRNGVLSSVILSRNFHVENWIHLLPVEVESPVVQGAGVRKKASGDTIISMIPTVSMAALNP